MEAQVPSPQTATSVEKSNINNDFAVGSQVIYGRHGRCLVQAVETKTVGGQSIQFYKLEVMKPPLSRSTRKEPAIWLPVDSAQAKGLRAPLNEERAEAVFEILANREYYFVVEDPWIKVLPQLEAAIRDEGATGLAKVASYLYVLRRRLHVPSSEMLKYQESVNKHLLRELSEAVGRPIRHIEDEISQTMRHKLAPDH